MVETAAGVLMHPATVGHQANDAGPGRDPGRGGAAAPTAGGQQRDEDALQEVARTHVGTTLTRTVR